MSIPAMASFWNIRRTKNFRLSTKKLSHDQTFSSDVTFFPTSRNVLPNTWTSINIRHQLTKTNPIVLCAIYCHVVEWSRSCMLFMLFCIFVHCFSTCVRGFNDPFVQRCIKIKLKLAKYSIILFSYFWCSQTKCNRRLKYMYSGSHSQLLETNAKG